MRIVKSAWQNRPGRFSFVHTMKFLSFSFFVWCALFTLSHGTGAGDSSGTFYRVSVGRATINDTTRVDTLSITLKSYPNELAAFDLKVGTDRSNVEILQILPGYFHDSCRWEFFNARSVKIIPEEGKPTSLWQVVAISETIPDDTAPACYLMAGEVELVKVVISIQPTNAVSLTPIPIFFYWEDCTDNTISSRSGDTLAISSRIVDFYPVTIPGQAELFPTRMGTPRQCVTPGLPNRPRRLVEFLNGGLEFKRITAEKESPAPDSTSH